MFLSKRIHLVDNVKYSLKKSNNILKWEASLGMVSKESLEWLGLYQVTL